MAKADDRSSSGDSASQSSRSAAWYGRGHQPGIVGDVVSHEPELSSAQCLAAVYGVSPSHMPVLPAQSVLQSRRRYRFDSSYNFGYDGRIGNAADGELEPAVHYPPPSAYNVVMDDADHEHGTERKDPQEQKRLEERDEPHHNADDENERLELASADALESQQADFEIEASAVVEKRTAALMAQVCGGDGSEGDENESQHKAAGGRNGKRRARRKRRPRSAPGRRPGSRSRLAASASSFGPSRVRRDPAPAPASTHRVLQATEQTPVAELLRCLNELAEEGPTHFGVDRRDQAAHRLANVAQVVDLLTRKLGNRADSNSVSIAHTVIPAAVTNGDPDADGAGNDDEDNDEYVHETFEGEDAKHVGVAPTERAEVLKLATLDALVQFLTRQHVHWPEDITPLCLAMQLLRRILEVAAEASAPANAMILRNRCMQLNLPDVCVHLLRGRGTARDPDILHQSLEVLVLLMNLPDAQDRSSEPRGNTNSGSHQTDRLVDLSYEDAGQSAEQSKGNGQVEGECFEERAVVEAIVRCGFTMSLPRLLEQTQQLPEPCCLHSAVTLLESIIRCSPLDVSKRFCIVNNWQGLRVLVGLFRSVDSADWEDKARHLRLLLWIAACSTLVAEHMINWGIDREIGVALACAPQAYLTLLEDKRPSAFRHTDQPIVDMVAEQLDAVRHLYKPRGPMKPPNAEELSVAEALRRQAMARSLPRPTGSSLPPSTTLPNHPPGSGAAEYPLAASADLAASAPALLLPNAVASVSAAAEETSPFAKPLKLPKENPPEKVTAGTTAGFESGHRYDISELQKSGAGVTPGARVSRFDDARAPAREIMARVYGASLTRPRQGNVHPSVAILGFGRTAAPKAQTEAQTVAAATSTKSRDGTVSSEARKAAAQERRQKIAAAAQENVNPSRRGGRRVRPKSAGPLRRNASEAAAGRRMTGKSFRQREQQRQNPHRHPQSNSQNKLFPREMSGGRSSAVLSTLAHNLFRDGVGPDDAAAPQVRRRRRNQEQGRPADDSRSRASGASASQCQVSNPSQLATDTESQEEPQELTFGQKLDLLLLSVAREKAKGADLVLRPPKAGAV